MPGGVGHKCQLATATLFRCRASTHYQDTTAGRIAIIDSFHSRAIHSGLLRVSVLKDFAEMFPDRFSNKTNGVTPRRWLLMANPFLARLLTDTVGKGWVTNMDLLRQLVPLADDAGFRDLFWKAKRDAKDADAWVRKAIINAGCSGKFSSDRTIREYASDIWHTQPSNVE